VAPAEADDVLVLTAAEGPDAGDGLDGLRALCVAHWSRHPGEGAGVVVIPGDERAGRAVDRWGLRDADGVDPADRS
jgi:hypothetical protein